MLPAKLVLGVLVFPCLACLLLGAGCGSDPYQLDLAKAGSLVGPTVSQTARPTSCPEDTQPAIVGLHGDAKTPEWGCLLACPVKQDYVTDVTSTSDGWSLAPTCQFVCDPGEHRLSYVDFNHQAHCAPGAVTDRAQTAAFARELRFQQHERAEEDRRTEILAQKKADEEGRAAGERRRQYQEHLSLLEDELHAMEVTPVPWTFDLVQEHHAFAREVDNLREEMHLESEVRDAMKARAAALLAKREASEKILGVRRPRREQATDHATRIRQCQSACDEQSIPCRDSCANLVPGTCATCTQVLTQCQATCATSTS